MVSQSFLCSFMLQSCIIPPYCPGTELLGSYQSCNPPASAAKCGIHTMDHVVCTYVKIPYPPTHSNCGCFYTSAFSFALLDLQK